MHSQETTVELRMRYALQVAVLVHEFDLPTAEKLLFLRLQLSYHARRTPFAFFSGKLCEVVLKLRDVVFLFLLANFFLNTVG